MQALHSDLKKAADKRSTSGSRKAACRRIQHLKEPSDKTVLNLTDPIAEALRGHPCLKHFGLMHVMISVSSEQKQEEKFSLDEILSSLATVPNLESLQLAGAFVALPSINSLPMVADGSEVCDFLEEHEDDFSFFLVLDEEEEDEDAADYETYVQNIREDGEWGGNVELVAAARFYRRNITVFTADLSAFTIPHGGSKVSGPDLYKLPTAIRNETLVIQQLLGPTSSNKLVSALRNLGLTDRTGLAIVHALAEPAGEPCALKELDVRNNPGITHLTYGELLDSLRSNRILHLCNVALDDDQYCQRLHLGFHRSSFACFPREEIDFYTKRLNTYGRAVFLDPTSATHKDCAQVLINARDDLDALFHLIQYRPLVLNENQVQGLLLRVK